MRRCDELAEFTEEPGRVTRRYLCEPMRGVHKLLRGWMRAAGLDTRIDSAGNLVARKRARGDARVLVIGSHLDSVPGGGKYDGVLGVMIGLALAESLSSSQLPFHLDLVGFSEEEGVRFNKPYLGSAAMAGWFRKEWLDRKDTTGVVMRDAVETFGLDPEKFGEAAYRPDEVIGYLEPHLEQGPVLERCGSPVGVVTGVVGQSRLRLAFEGEAGHAGTTPMEGRHDALVCAAEFVRVVRALATLEENKSGDLRATVGKLKVVPNAPNVIPQRVEFSLDVRHPDDGHREATIERALAAGRMIGEQEGCKFDVIENTPETAVAVDDRLSGLLTEAVHEQGLEPIRLPSGAGHDAVAMARRFPVAMLFLRHPGGVSHHPDERVDAADVAVAVEVLERFLVRLAEKVSAEP